MDSPVEITLLGGFEVTREGASVSSRAWRYRRAADLVKLLALSPRHRMHREVLVEVLWPHLSPEAGDRNLHKAIHFARKEIGDSSAITLGQEVALENVRVDVDRFEQVAKGALDTDDVEACLSAADLYTGELLPEDRYEEWTQRPRDRLRLLYVDLLRRGGRWNELLEVEPLDEMAHRELMKSFFDAGNRTAALRQFRRLKDLLARELGLRPSPETTALYEEIRRGPATVAPVDRTGPLVGRADELETATSELRGLDQGKGGGLLVAGEAGIGKTRFCEAVLVEAAASGRTTLRGTAHPEEGATPFAAIAEALDRLLLERPDLLESLSEDAQADLARLVVSSPATPSQGDPATIRRRIFSAVAQVLSAAARERGTVLLLEDLHAADDGTIQLAHYLVRSARFQPLLVVLSYRTGRMPSALELLRTRLLSEHAAPELILGPLSRQETAQMITQKHDRPLSEDLIELIWSKAGGNPFFIQELLSGISPEGELAVPEHLYDILQTRLRGLDPPLRDLMEQAAIVGEEFSVDEFTAIGDVDETTAFDVLDEALAEGLIAEHSGGFRFTHPLLREALLKALPPHRRRAAHRMAADVLAASAAPAARIAHHLVEGGREDKAVPWLERAARNAAAVGAYADGLSYVETALDHTDRHRRPDLLEVRADLLFAAGDPASAVAYGEAISARRGRESTRLRIRRSRAHLAAGEVAAAARCIEGLEAVDAETRTSLLLARGSIAWHLNDLNEAETRAKEARRLAIDQGLADVASEATALLAMVAHNRGQIWDQVRSEVLDSVRKPDLAASVLDAHLCVVEFSLYGGEPYEQVAEFARELWAAADRAGAMRGAAFAATVLGESELLSGRIEVAEDHLSQAAELARRSRAPASRAMALQRLAEAALARRRPTDAARRAAEALAVAEPSHVAQHLLPRIYAVAISAATKPTEALDLVHDAEAALTETPPCHPCSIGFLIATTIAQAGVGDLKGARETVEEAETVASMWPGGAWAAGVLEAKAMIRIAEGDLDDAVSLLNRAANGFQGVGQPVDEQRCRSRLEEIEARESSGKN